MNQWILPIAFVALVLVFGAVAFVKAQSNSAPVKAEIVKTGCGMARCDGGCTAQSNRGSANCGATNGGSCGCCAK